VSWLHYVVHRFVLSCPDSDIRRCPDFDLTVSVEANVEFFRLTAEPFGGNSLVNTA
jgi:hypothetical protein